MKYIELLSELTKKADEYDFQRTVENEPNLEPYILDLMRKEASVGKNEINIILEKTDDGKLKFEGLELDAVIKKFESCGFKAEVYTATIPVTVKYDHVVRISWPRIYKHEEL